MEDTKDKFKLEQKTLKISKISLIITSVIIVIVSIFTLGYVSKNITYTSRFTPPSMRPLLQSNSLYTYSQIFILITNIFLVFAITFQLYASFKLKSKILKITLAVTIIVWAECLTCALLFLCGGWGFQGELKKQYISMQGNSGVCSSTFCSAADCGRLNSYKSTVNMQIAYCVIVSLLGAITFPLSFVVNFNRIQNLQSLEV